MFPYQNGTWNQAYVISFTLFPIIVNTQKIKMCWDFLSQVQRRLSGERDRLQEEFAAAHSSVDSAKKFK